MSYYSGSPSRISTKKGHHVVFKSSGSKPLDRCHSGGTVTRVYDKSSKGYVLALSGGRSTSVRFPKKRTASLGLTSARPYLILQVYVPVGRPFTSEIVISDDKLTRRRLIFSTAFKEELYGELHAQISLQNLERGKWLNLCINMLSLMDICFEHDGKTNFRVVDAITVNSVCKLRNVYVLRDNPYGKGGLPPEVAFANGVDSSYVLCDDQYVIDRRPVHEAWINNGGIDDFVNKRDLKTPSRASSAVGSERRGGGFGSVSANTTPHLAFGTRFTPSPGRKPNSAKRSARTPSKSGTPPRRAMYRDAQRKNDRSPASLEIKNMKLTGYHSDRSTSKTISDASQPSPAKKADAFITPKVKRSLVNRHTSPMLRNRYETSPQYSVPPATPNTPIESPAPKRTPVAQALTLEETPPPSPCRSYASTTENDMSKQLHDSTDDIFTDEPGRVRPKTLVVPGVTGTSYNDRNYDDSEEEIDANISNGLLRDENIVGSKPQMYSEQSKDLNSSLDSEDLYGDVREGLNPAIVASNNTEAENSASFEDDNAESINLNEEDEDKMPQQENSINAEYEIQFQNKIYGRTDDRVSESGDEEEVQVDAHNNEEMTVIEDPADASRDADLSDELETFGERLELSGTDEVDMVTGPDMWEQENMDRSYSEDEEEVSEHREEIVSDRVSDLSDDLARKRALLEEKRRKLLELEQSYMHEFGEEEEEENLVADLPVEDIELNDKENSSADRNVETVVGAHDRSGAQALGDGASDSSNVGSNASNMNVHKEASVELIYDPVLACYFDPKSGKYYEIQS